MSKELKQKWIVGVLVLIASWMLYSNVISPFMGSRPTANTSVVEAEEIDYDASDDETIQIIAVKQNLRYKEILNSWDEMDVGSSMFRDPFKFHKSKKKKKPKKTRYKKRKKIALKPKVSTKSEPSILVNGEAKGPVGLVVGINGNVLSKGDSLNDSKISEINKTYLVVDTKDGQKEIKIKRSSQ
jgi:hypothetical protein